MEDSTHIYYKEGFKYQLDKTCVYNTPYRGYQISTRYLTLSPEGLLIIYQGYCWDGPSGPTVDSNTFMRGSLVHDAIYQLIRMTRLPMQCRQVADYELRKICLQDGMIAFRAWYVYHSVDKLATSAASPRNIKKVIKAP